MKMTEQLTEALQAYLFAYVSLQKTTYEVGKAEQELMLWKAKEFEERREMNAALNKLNELAEKLSGAEIAAMLE